MGARPEYLRERELETINATQTHGTAEPLCIRLFGALEVQQFGVPVLRTRTRKEQWLLALLVLSRGQPLERPWLAGLLWPDTPEEGALGHLRRSLSELRRVLGSDASRLSAPTPRSLRLDLAGTWVDVFEFDAAVKRGDVASLEQAITLYRAPLLHGCQEEWVVPERVAREQEYLQALEAMAAGVMARNEYGLCVGYLRKVIAVDPLRETAWQGLMQAFADSGDFAASNGAFRDLRTLLHREMNIAPSSATTALFQQLQAAAHKQMQGSGSANKRTGNSETNRIPQPVSSMVGREKETREVVSFLSSARLVTLTGAGGVGKTRLAIAVAQELAENYADGAWFVDLAPLSDGSLIPQAVASTLGIREDPGQPVIQALCTHLRSKTVLLLLDNCEHLVTACGHLAEALLHAVPGLRLLATSREDLGITGEVTYRVPCLSLPDSWSIPSAEHLSGYEAIRLFVERAHIRNQAFHLTEDNSKQVLSICRILDGIPLAIELAAARVRGLTIDEIEARLVDRFAFLTGGSRTAVPRQQTLQATVDWSYRSLSEKEKSVLQYLSILGGGWTLEAAEAICTGETIARDEVLNLLMALVDKSQVVYEEQQSGGRYRFLETMRQYARERLRESEIGNDAWERHQSYFLKLVEDIEPRLVGPDQTELFAQLEAEHDNLRSALEYCSAAGNSAIGLRLTGALWRFWYTHGHAFEGQRRLTTALDARGADAPTEARAKALNGLGGIALSLGDNAAGQKAMEECLAIRRTLGNETGVTMVLNNLGIIALDLGDFRKARALHEEALVQSRRRGDRMNMAVSLVSAGYCAFLQGDYRVAREYNEESLILSRQLEDRRSIAFALDNLGDIARVCGQFTQAYSRHSEALVIVFELGDQRTVAQCLEGFGRLAAEQGDAERALRIFAFENALRASISSPQSAAEQKIQADYIVSVRSILSPREFEHAWSDGAAMPLEQAVGYALQSEVQA